LDADPLVSMSPPKLDRPMVHAVADAEVTALLRACEGKAFADKRDTALVRLLVSTGMRAGEALSLTTGSVDTGHQVITVKHGKGGKDRIVPLLPETAKALAVYLRARKRHPQANQRRSETRVPADAWNRAIMTIDQLIEAATEARDELGGDAEVRLCWQPEYPIRGTLEAVTVPESDPYDEGEIAAGQENDSRMLWLAAGAVPYGENPYASSWAWEGASAW
jgi:integrase